MQKLASVLLAVFFFYESTVFAQLRAMPTAGPPAVEARAPVKSPYFFSPSTTPEPVPVATTVAPAEPAAPPPVPIPLPQDVFASLATWTVEGDLARGAWALSPSGYEVTQQIDDGPTFFVSPDSHVDVTVRGKLRVDPSEKEKGSVGIVLGYRAPLASEGHDERESDFVLFDWRGRKAKASERGFTLSRVKGFVADPYAVFSDRMPPSVVELLAADRGSSKGWQKSRWYPFEISSAEDGFGSGSTATTFSTSRTFSRKAGSVSTPTASRASPSPTST